MFAATRHKDHKVNPALHASYSPALTTHTSPLAIAEVYQNLQQERFEHPHNIRLAYRNRVGTLIRRELSFLDLTMRDGEAVSVVMMDLTFELTLRDAPWRVMSSPAMNLSHDEACLWMCLNPPPADFHGLRLNAVCNHDVWVLYIEEYGGPETERSAAPRIFPSDTDIFLA